jgi:DNA repair and recombination protein RAD52
MSFNNTHAAHAASNMEHERRTMISRTEQYVADSYPHGRSSDGIVRNYVRNPANQNSVLLDQHNRPVTVDRILATKPLKQDLMTRPGPGNRKLTYMSGDGVSRSLNEIFGYEGWSLDIKSVTQTGKDQDKSQRWQVCYLAHVRITLTGSGTYKEDMGSGDSMDRNLQTAVSHAMKASITDALKRTARHFGDKLGNSLYDADFAISKAPTTMFMALDNYEKHSREKFGAINVPKAHVPGEQAKFSGRAQTATPKIAPPPLAAQAPSHGHAITPSATPHGGVANTYSRRSLPAQANTVSNSTFATPRTNTSVPPPVNAGAFPEQAPPIHPVLSDHAATVNSAPRTTSQSMKEIFQSGQPECGTRHHQLPPLSNLPTQPPFVRPPSSRGKRQSMGPAIPDAAASKRTRHNPYA